jgi:translocation and assembly module TamB
VNRKRIIFWAIAGILAVLVLAVSIPLLLLEHNQRFRGYLLQRVERSIEESTGARVTVRDLKVQLSSLQLDLYGIVVHGTEAASQRPLLTADYLAVSVKIDSVFGRKWHLHDLTADHPVASVSVNKAGVSNLPKPEKPSTGNTNIFELAIDQVAIHQGEIYYNDQKSMLDAALAGLQLETGFDRVNSRYFGDLRYDNGRIQYGAYAPVVHNLDAEFQITPQTFRLDRLVVGTGKSRLTLTAVIDDYANNPRLQAGYGALLATADASRILKTSSIPQGEIRIAGSLRYASKPNRPLLECVTVSGILTSNELRTRASDVRTVIRDLKAQYKLVNGNAEVGDLRAQVLGGSVEGGLTIRDIAGAQEGRFQVGLHGVSLEQLQRLSHTRPSTSAQLRGSMAATARGGWSKNLKNVLGHADINIRGALGQNPGTPVNGAIHADYAGASQQATLHQSYLRTPQSSITLDGKLSQNSQLRVHATSGDLHELELLASNFRSPTPVSSSSPERSPSNESSPGENLGLYGTGSLDATISGPMASPQIEGNLLANNLRVRGSSWKLLRTNITAGPSALNLKNGELVAATQGRFTFNVHAVLNHWSFTPSNPVEVNLSASQLSIADLEKLAGRNDSVSGTVSLNVAIHGSLLEPAGQGNISVSHAMIGNEPVSYVNLDFNGTGDSVNANATAGLAAGTAEAHATVDPKTRAYRIEVRAHDVRLERLQAVKARNMQVTGGVNLDVSGQGTVASPALDATLIIPQLQMQKQTLQGITLHANIRDHLATLALDSEVAQAFIKGRGTIGLEAPYIANIQLDTGRIAFQPLVALYAPAQAANVSGQTELHLSLRGPLTDKSRIQGHVEIPVLTAAYQQFQIGSAKPIHIDYENGTVVLQPASLQGTGMDINIHANVPVNNLNAATLTLKGAIDLKVAHMLVPDLESAGQIRFNIDSDRSGGANGQIQIVDASVHSAAVPNGVDHANGVINVTPTRMDIGNFQGQMGEGKITLKGGLQFRPSVQFNLGLQADNIRLRYPDGIRALLATNLSLTGTPQASAMAGQLRIEHVSFTPDFDLTNFVGQFGDSSDTAASGGILDSMRLRIAVQSTSQMNLQSSQVSVSGNADLLVTGTAAQPVVLGHTRLSGGELFFGGNRYVIQDGTIDFLNPVRTEPVLNLKVRTKINDYNVTLGLRGPISRLRTTYTSDPALPPADIINLVTRGQTTEAAAAQPSQPLSLGAESLLASTVGSQVGSKVAKVAGISQLQIDPSLGANNGQNPGARIAVQERVTGNLFVTFATDITSTQRQAAEAEYHLNPRWSLTGVRDQNGGFSAQAYYRKKF